ncbi:global transactivator [Fusarium bulbicola]|nr:global transactivator [Fusarium bulbicola]
MEVSSIKKDSTRLPKTNPSLFTDFMESGCCRLLAPQGHEIDGTSQGLARPWTGSLESNKNRNTRTFVAVTALRGQSEGCLALKGTPLDNTWEDAYALPSLLEGHLITDFNTLQKTFKELGQMAPLHHTGKHMTRYIQMLDAASFSNPISTLQDRPPHRTSIVLRFALASDGRRKTPRSKKEDIDDAIPDNADAQPLAHAAEWCQHLEQGDNSLSRRVQTILDIVRRRLDFRPDDSFIVVDESLWFLDIVTIAPEKTYQPVSHDTCNGRLDTIQRHLTINKVARVTPLHTLLTSRGTGGQGLNMQFANVIIRCGHWWKKAWGQQAVGRVHRPGQQKPNFIYELRAQDFALGNYKMEDKGW